MDARDEVTSGQLRITLLGRTEDGERSIISREARLTLPSSLTSPEGSFLDVKVLPWAPLRSDQHPVA